MTDHAFRFYGAAPAEFEEGFPPYLARFRDVADPAAQDAIVAAFKAALAEHGLRSGGAVRWDGSSALFVLDERVEDWDELFDGVAGVMLAIHAVHPLEEVVFLNATPPCDDAWTQWSVTQQAHPTPGPRFGFRCDFD